MFGFIVASFFEDNCLGYDEVTGKFHVNALHNTILVLYAAVNALASVMFGVFGYMIYTRITQFPKPQTIRVARIVSLPGWPCVFC